MSQTGKGRRAARARHDGVLLLDKPRGLSSSAALMRARRALGGARAGHGGTLDPLASGLLPLLFGEATKFAHGLLDADKTYLAELHLGLATTTGDAEGEVRADRRDRLAGIDMRRCIEILERFVGEIDQVPPMHSALKRDGKPLYEYARAGMTLERPARRIRVYRIDPLDFDGERLRIRVACSKGTYIRVLAEDIGEALGCGAHLSALRRERVGDLALEDAITLDELSGLDERAAAARLAPIDSLLGAIPMIELGAAEAVRFGHGQRLRLATGSAPAGQVRVYGPGGLLGLARLDEGLLAPTRLVAAPPDAAPSRTDGEAETESFPPTPFGNSK
ncbi:MAG: tRNA pseudouridine(55) synthase TruB [Burkholderiaceae bacterium]